MKLKSTIPVALTLSIAVLIAITLLALSHNQGMQEYLDENERIESILTSTFELNFLTNEYIINPRERSKIQWLNKYYDLRDSLEQVQVSDPKIKGNILDIQNNLGKLKTQFLNLMELRHQEQSIQSENKTISSVETAIVTQMLILSEDIVSDSNLISEITRENVLDKIRIRTQLMLIISTTTLVLFGLFFIAIRQLILKPLELLHEGTKKISSGDLEHKIELVSNDELGELGISFNTMSSNLKKTLDSLKDELETRKRIESKLNALNQQLTANEQHLRAANQQLTLSEERFKSTLERMFEGCQIIGFDWRYLFVNEAAAKHGRTSVKMLLGKTMMECYPGIEKTEMFSKLKIVMDERMSMQFENVFTYPEGKTGVFLLSVLPSPEGIFIVSMDMSEKKRAENEIQKYVKSLEKQRIATLNLLKDVQETKKNLENANEQIMSVNKELENYTYVVSHDLKQPLRSMKSFSQFLIDDYSEKIDDTGKDYLKRVINAADRMEDLISSLLKLSRVGRVDTEFSKVSMQELMDEVIQDLEEIIRRMNGSVNTENLPQVYCQRTWIKEVFMNLVSNGLKFNKNKKPEISIGCSEKDDYYEFYVRDNGIGIEKEYQDRVFKLFERLHSRKYYEGSGAGLAIIKSIIENHKGRIWIAESEPGKGTLFKFTIPKNKPK